MNSTSLSPKTIMPEARMQEPRPIGRPTVLEAMGLTIEGIVATYKVQKTLPKTAAVLGVSVNTCKKYLKIAKATSPRGGRAQPFSWRRRTNGPVYEWFVQHRNERLPRSITELSAKTGFRPAQLKKFLFTRKTSAADYLRSLGDLREQVGHVIDVLGRRIPLGMLQEYVLKVDMYDLTVRIEASLRMGGRVNVLLTFRQYEEVFKREKERLMAAARH